MNNVTHTILVVSEDAQISNNLSANLADNRYKLVSATDGIEALYIAEKTKASIVILDFDIPKISASEVAVLVKKIPRLHHIYVLLLHPENYSFDLNGIVDEYMQKPIDGKTLASKIKNITKSLVVKSFVLSNLRTKVGDLIVDRDAYMVFYKGNEFLLPRKEFELIFLLSSRPEKVFTREEIFKHIWHKEITLEEGRTIDVHIRKLRSKISETLITTIKGIGYKMAR